MAGLSVSRLVNVTVNLSAQAAAGRSFGVLMIAGDSNVISGLQRYRSYSDIDGVIADFGSTAPEVLAAELYFGQTPTPAQMMVGRWLRTATAGQNIGGILAPADQAIANWTAIANGGFGIAINGTVQNLTGLNFTGVTNLNGVATAITTALSGATCVWDGSEFVITSGTTGVGAAASGTVTFTANPTAADTLTIGGTQITFVASAPTGNQVLIGANAVATAANLQLFLNATTDTNLIKASYATASNVLTITYKLVGTGGNSFALVKSSTAITLSGAALSGGTVPSSVGYATTGTGTDISTQLKLTQALSQSLIPGYAAETPAQCAAALASKSAAWYGLMFAASTMPTDQQYLDTAAYIEALDVTRMFGVSIQNTNVLSPLVTSDLASLLMAGGYEQTFCQYSSSTPYVVASMFGRAFSVNFAGQNTTIALMYKQQPGVTPEVLDDTGANTLQAKRCNVYATYANDTSIIQYGVMSGPAYIDEIHGLDWFQNAIQTAEFNVLYTSTTKIPQTDAGQNQLTNAAAGVCDQGIANGLGAPGTWNGPSFGELTTGQYLKSGYYIYSAPVALQSQADRDARKAQPIQIAFKLAGANQEVDVLVTVNR